MASPSMPDKRLVLCEHGDRRVARLEEDGRKTTLADRYEGKRLNSPNDLVFAGNGDLYFTDPPLGLPKGFDDPGKELGWSGVYRLTPEGRLTLLTRELKAPNGIALSPSSRTLYVSNADRSHRRVDGLRPRTRRHPRRRPRLLRRHGPGRGRRRARPTA